MKTTAQEKKELLRIAANGNAKGVAFATYAQLYHSKLITCQGRITQAGKAHLRTFAKAMTSAPSKRTYRVLSPVVKDGRTLKPGETFEACPAGVHIQRWLEKGWVLAR